jgi:hypothetical protein
MSTILITSGGTKVHIDEVRHVGNMSSGRFGADLAREALKKGHTVIFIYAKGSVRPDQVILDLRGGSTDYRDRTLMSDVAKVLGDYKYLEAVQKNLFMVEYRDFDEYAAVLQKWLVKAKPDVTMLAAAVSDYGMPPVGGKISSDKDSITFTMTKLPKLITHVKEWCPTTTLVGFKLLVDTNPVLMFEAASKQIETAGCDLVAVNDLRMIKKDMHFLFLYEKSYLTDNPVVLRADPAGDMVTLATRVAAGRDIGVSYVNRLSLSDVEFGK